MIAAAFFSKQTASIVGVGLGRGLANRQLAARSGLWRGGRGGAGGGNWPIGEDLGRVVLDVHLQVA